MDTLETRSVDGRHAACTIGLVAPAIRVQVRDRRKFVNDQVAQQFLHDPKPALRV